MPAERYLNVSPVREVSSAPNSRSCSFKRPNKLPQELQGVDLDLRPRTNSMPPCPSRRQRHASDGSSTQEKEPKESLCRVRSFKMTSKGLVNHGDSFKRRSTHSLMSTGSANTDQSGEHRPRTLSVASQDSTGVISGSGSCIPPSYFRVALLGASGVGKSALIKQFMTSEYRGTFDIATPDAEDPETTVSVLLDGEESMIEFIDEIQAMDDNLRADAYAVVFSLSDSSSYHTAVNTLRHLRVELGSDRAVVLVGNKVDLVRQRRVSGRDARLLAMKYDCEYEETSAALNHRVDELLVSVLSQIRRKLSPHAEDLLPAEPATVTCHSPSPRRAMSFLSKLFNQTKKKARSCDSLLIH